MSLSHLRPLAFGEILDGSFTLLRRHFPLMAGTALVAHIPGTVLLSVWRRGIPAGSSPGLEQMGGFFLAMAVMGVATLFVWAMLARMMSQALTGGEVSVGDGARRGAASLLPLLGAALLCYFALIAIVFVLFIPVGIIAVVAGMAGAEPRMAVLVSVLTGLVMLVVAGLAASNLFAVLPAVVLERLGPLASIGRSFRLVAGARLRVTGVVVVAWLIYYLPQLAAMLLSGSWRAMLDPERATMPSFSAMLLQDAVALLGGAVTTPFFMGCLVLLYYDRRIRAEAFGLFPEETPASPALA